MNEVKNTLKELMGTKKAEPTKAEPKYKNIKNPSVTVAIRLRADLKDKLEKHFTKKGYLSLSTGLRAVIGEYADREGLL